MKRLVLFSICCFAAAAQHQHGAAAPSQQPVSLYPGLGIWTHPIATHNPQAQKFFDQGLALLYGFNRPEALRSFRKTLELDPHAAMGWWGISMALGPYLNMDMDPDVKIPESCSAAADGLRLPGLQAADRAWLAAAQARCPGFSDPARYVAAMRTLAAANPDDPDAQTWYAESLLLPVRWRWYAGDQPAEGVAEAERVLESVLRRYPDHPGANHLYVHAVESSPTPERAVPSAQRLMGLMPSAGHIVHMPGHIWLVLGEYNTTVDVNERAAQVDREYFARTGVSGSYYMYYLHNLQFIVYARAMQGRVADTVKAIAAMREAAKPLAQSMPEMADVVGFYVTLMQLRANRWDALLGEPRPASPSPLAQAMWRYGRALSLAMKSKLPEAKQEQAEFETERAKLDRNLPWDTNKLGDVMDLASAALEARLETDSARAAGRWRHAIEIQDRLAYDEPPAWYYPLRESLGAALLQAGDSAAAEAVFREGLRRSPKNGRMLFGLLESLKAQGKTEAAAWVDREFRAAWKGADLELRIREM